jgi:hypothetical protein
MRSRHALHEGAEIDTHRRLELCSESAVSSSDSALSPRTSPAELHCKYVQARSHRRGFAAKTLSIRLPNGDSRVGRARNAGATSRYKGSRKAATIAHNTSVCLTGSAIPALEYVLGTSRIIASVSGTTQAPYRNAIT